MLKERIYDVGIYTFDEDRHEQANRNLTEIFKKAIADLEKAEEKLKKTEPSAVDISVDYSIGADYEFHDYIQLTTFIRYKTEETEQEKKDAKFYENIRECNEKKNMLEMIKASNGVLTEEMYKKGLRFYKENK